jgi:hypothetical protein
MSASQYVGIGILAGYWAVLLTTRWMFIARPNRRFTLARIDDAQYFMQPTDGKPTLLDQARVVAAGKHLYEEPQWLRQRRGVQDGEDDDVGGRLKKALLALGQRVTAPLIWNGSRDLVAWNLLHRVEAHEASKKTGPELVAVLMKAQSQLADLPPEKRIYWSRVLHDLLEGCPQGRLRDEAVAQALTHQLLSELYNARDTKFTNLATQQNKVTWMVFTGLVIMGALVSLGYEQLLLAGAVGGVLSRLQRELQRRDVPSDYGLSWSVLFLSPVSGALSAWAGLLLLQSLQDFGVVDLAQLLPAGADLTDPSGAVLGVAILLGLSERVLDRIVRQAEDEISVKPGAEKTPEPVAEPPRTPAPAQQPGVVGP